MGLRVGCGRDGLIIACLPWLVQVRQLRPVARAIAQAQSTCRMESIYYWNSDQMDQPRGPPLVNLSAMSRSHVTSQAAPHTLI